MLKNERRKNMKIAIASGKGGTGKTTIATNLALSASGRGEKIVLADCDVEEPNCHLFLDPVITSSEPVAVQKPEVIESLCTGCGLCGEVCEYNAIAVIKKKVLIFPELCHSCGACSILCPENAVTETPRNIGILEKGTANGISFIQGLLNIGELMSPAVISAVRKAAGSEGHIIVDAPPGTSCPVIEAVKENDFVILVSEPTPFGLHDLTLAVGMVRQLELPFAVALNRCDIGTDELKNYCISEGIDIIFELPDDRRIAEAYSRGEMIIKTLPEYRNLFESCWNEVIDRVVEKDGIGRRVTEG